LKRKVLEKATKDENNTKISMQLLGKSIEIAKM
jgi:hypothetical protein